MCCKTTFLIIMVSEITSANGLPRIHNTLNSSGNNMSGRSNEDTGTYQKFEAKPLNGCFHGNLTIDVGQVYYDGDYKCICVGDNWPDCKERCPIFKNTDGLEECDWIPAPDDPYCKVPLCDKANKKNLPHDLFAQLFCISKDGKKYKIGQPWQQWDDRGVGLQRRCQCVLTNGVPYAQCDLEGPTSTRTTRRILQPSTNRLSSISSSVTTPTATTLSPKITIDDHLNAVSVDNSSLNVNSNPDIMAQTIFNKPTVIIMPSQTLNNESDTSVQVLFILLFGSVIIVIFLFLRRKYVNPETDEVKRIPTGYEKINNCSTAQV